ncbi:hypothetical protein QCA50_003563 [Cerrena zonata]|uniref:Uncharacterized protein n=1 Tax=Cerrena zonata TaxID=2478898 RepID=A0AAW0GK61_9APHY
MRAIRKGWCSYGVKKRAYHVCLCIVFNMAHIGTKTDLDLPRLNHLDKKRLQLGSSSHIIFAVSFPMALVVLVHFQTLPPCVRSPALLSVKFSHHPPGPIAHALNVGQPYEPSISSCIHT